MMNQAFFVVREPLIDASGTVSGYELSLQHDGEVVEMDQRAESAFLISFVAEQFLELGAHMMGDEVIFLSLPPHTLEESDIADLIPQRIVFCLSAEDIDSERKFALIKTLRARGFGLSMPDSVLALENRLLELLTHIECDFNSPTFSQQVAHCHAIKSPSTNVVARGIETWQDYDLCAELGASAFVGNLHLTPRPEMQAKGLNPAQTVILQLMHLVRQDAEIRDLENVLKRDPAIAYKLLTYINSAGFGLGVEIQSLRHAVTMLGFSPLYRWLSLLLATASTSGYSLALMQAAIIRGRFAELLGQNFLPKSEAENLFVAGMFSLLDCLLGIPMEEVLENIQLSDSVSEALLTRGGIYGPFLALAEACEMQNGHVGELADALFIDALKVNRAHIAALTWAQNFKL